MLIWSGLVDGRITNCVVFGAFTYLYLAFAVHTRDEGLLGHVDTEYTFMLSQHVVSLYY